MRVQFGFEDQVWTTFLFGFGPALWQDIIAKAVALRADIEDDEIEDDELMDHARELRTLLRQYV